MRMAAAAAVLVLGLAATPGAAYADSATITVPDLTFTHGVTLYGLRSVYQSITVDQREGAVRDADIMITMPAGLGSGVNLIDGCVETTTDTAWTCKATGTVVLRIEYQELWLVQKGTDGAATRTYDVTASTIGFPFRGTGHVIVKPSADMGIHRFRPSPNGLELWVGDNGPSGATDVVLRVSGYQSVAPGVLPASCAWEGLEVVCRYPFVGSPTRPLGPDWPSEYYLDLPMPAEGPHPMTATVASLYPDPNPANNARALDTTPATAERDVVDLAPHAGPDEARGLVVREASWPWLGLVLIVLVPAGVAVLLGWRRHTGSE